MKTSMTGFAVLATMVLALAVAAGCGRRSADTADTPAEGGTGAEEQAERSPSGGMELMRARHILVSWQGCGIPGVTRTREEALELAGEVRDQLASGGRGFVEMAASRSDCPSAAFGGRLPDFSSGALPSVIEETVSALEPGQLSRVVESRFGFHLLLRDG